MRVATEPSTNELQRLAERYGRDRAALLPIVEALEEEHHFVSPRAMQELADLLGIHPVEVYGVVTFYGHLGLAPRGRFVLRLCRTLSCELAGKDEIAEALREAVGTEFGRTTADGLFTLEWANCVGLCDQGPALLVNERAFTRVNAEEVRGIVAHCRILAREERTS